MKIETLHLIEKHKKLYIKGKIKEALDILKKIEYELSKEALENTKKIKKIIENSYIKK